MRKGILSLLLMVLGGAPAVSAQVSGTMELTLARDGAKWNAEVSFNAVGQTLSSLVRDLKVLDNEIAFATTMLGAELRFSGKVTNDSIAGTIHGLQAGAAVATGTWSATRQKTNSTAEALVGKWLGAFILQQSVQPGAPRPGGALDFNANVTRPAYVEQHPKVLFDEAHNNADTSAGRYKPFADLITSDGYTVSPNRESFSKAKLSGYALLVIVNASGPQARRDAAAFSEEECDAVRDWVSQGGGLLLITDHAPFSAAATVLSKRFGVDLMKGYTVDPSHDNKESGDQTELVFTRDDGLLADHPITRGRDAAERINRIITFSGTSAKGPEGSAAILKLTDTALDILPPNRKPSPEEPSPDHQQVSAGGRAQGVALSLGKGRVVVLCEAAMLTSQVAPQGFRFGMNVAGFDNRQLALNIMHWLSGLINEH